MKQGLLLLSLLFFANSGFALMDARNANYSETFVDMEVPSSGYDLKIQRTYNSRTVYNGMFGFGWCSDFETKATVTPENTIKVKECGAGLEVEYRVGKADRKALDKVVATIMKEVKSRNKTRDAKYFANLEKEIRQDESLRDEFARQLELTGQVRASVKYMGEGRSNDTISYEKGSYVRHLPSGVVQKFSKEGLMTEIRDTVGNWARLTYDGTKLVRIVDNAGTNIQFKYNPGQKYVHEIVGPNGLKATYSYSGEKLVAVKNAWKNTYKFQYDDLYNITRIDFPDKTYVALSYNKDKDWVTSFRDREGCQETYRYEDNPKTPLNNYRTLVEKRCGNEVTNKSVYEFWHKTKKDGTRYLSKSRADINGEITEMEYHEVTGRPITLEKGGITTHFSYFANGLLQSKREPGREMLYKYNNRCQKPSEVLISYLVPAKQKARARQPSKVETKKVKSVFRYNPRTCLLTDVKNSDGQYAKLDYDRRGRINKIVDQTKKLVLIKYEDRFGKPATITRPQLGSIRFKYKSNGDLEKIESGDEPLVAVQVANVFRELLDMIAPGTTDNPI